MRINKSVMGLLAVAALAFTAGRMEFFSGVEPVATAADTKKPKKVDVKKELKQELTQGQPGELDPEMQAWIEAVAPDDHHKLMEDLVGKWDSVFTIRMKPGAEPMTTHATVEREMVLGGRFLKEVVDSVSEMGEFHAIGLMGYNKTDGRYEYVWLDDMSTAINMGTGTIDADTQVMRMHYSVRDALSGKMHTARSEMDLSNPDRHTLVEYLTGPDGKEYKWMEGVMKRRGNG